METGGRLTICFFLLFFFHGSDFYLIQDVR